MQNQKPSWCWNIFFLLYVFAAISAGSTFFAHDSIAQNYYRILVGFDTLLIIFYLSNALAVLIDILSILPFYFFVKPEAFEKIKKLFSNAFWLKLFLIRITLLLCGHSFELKQIQSLWRGDPRIACILLFSISIFYIPSFIANCIFAYRMNKK